MNITIVKLTQSKNQKNLAFADIRLESLQILLKGVRIISNNLGGMTIALPTVNAENRALDGKKAIWIPYTPFTFLSKDAHNEFIAAVKDHVGKLLNIAERKK